MRVIDPNLVQLMMEDHISVFLLLTIGPFADGTYIRVTTLPYDITIDGKNYSADNKIASIDAPNQSAPIDKETYKITLIDSNYDLRYIIEEGYTGIPLTLNAGFINTYDFIFQDTAPNDPILKANMMYNIYKGLVDRVSYNITVDNEVLVEFECSSPLGPIDITRTILTSRDWMRLNFPGDTSFDQVFIGSQQEVILWGKLSERD